MVARVYNKNYSTIIKLSQDLGATPEVLVGIISTESQGTAGLDDKMLIRFEVHKFYEGWGSKHPEKFREHFKFNPTQQWLGHKISHDGKNWKVLHPTGSPKDLPLQYEALQLALSLDDSAKEAAYGCLGMGLGQVQGFNAKSLGYKNASDMFSKLSGNEAEQIHSVYMFIKSRPKLLTAVINHDWQKIEKYYNGGGQGGIYATRMSSLAGSLEEVAKAQHIDLKTGRKA